VMVQRHGDADDPASQAADADAPLHLLQLDIVRKIVSLNKIKISKMLDFNISIFNWRLVIDLPIGGNLVWRSGSRPRKNWLGERRLEESDCRWPLVPDGTKWWRRPCNSRPSPKQKPALTEWPDFTKQLFKFLIIHKGAKIIRV
jgi:hypothetical protein